MNRNHEVQMRCSLCRQLFPPYWMRSELQPPPYVLCDYCAGTGARPRGIYLAARYSRLEEMRTYARVLRDITGAEATSRWILGNHKVTDSGLSDEAAAEERTRFAREDYEDVIRADWVVSFTEKPRSSTTRGGRHVELGIGLATGKRTIVVGPRENVFHCLDAVEWYPDWGRCETALIAEAYGRSKTNFTPVGPGWADLGEQVARSIGG